MGGRTGGRAEGDVEVGAPLLVHAHGPPQLDDGGSGEGLAAAGAAGEHHDGRAGCQAHRLPLPRRQLHLCKPTLMAV